MKVTQRIIAIAIENPAWTMFAIGLTSLGIAFTIQAGIAAGLGVVGSVLLIVSFMFAARP